MQPLVSIITPSYNSSIYISTAIESVLNQTYQNWELLITDDCSTDDTVTIIKGFSKVDTRIKLFQLSKNSGSGPTRNKSIQEARGKYIAFLDSDDIWITQKLEKQVIFMQKNNISVCHASYGYIDEKGNEIRKPYLVSKQPVDYNYLLKHTDISCLTAMFDQELIGKFFMPALRRKQDYALWLSILKKGNVSVPYPINEILAYYRQHKLSATNNKWSLLIKHFTFLKRHEKLNSFSSLLYTLFWIIGGLKKHYL